MDKAKPIIALDFATIRAARNFLAYFNNDALNVKVGMEMYYAFGPQIIRELKQMGHAVFLDLKLHDIPNTVERAIKQLALLGVDMVNVHASGGSKMMQAARKGIIAGTPTNQKSPLLIAVTQLTSTTEVQVRQEQNIASSLEDSVLNYALLTKANELDGVVCSPLEVQSIKEHAGKQFITVTPGIRPAKTILTQDDQNRISTAAQAREYGSDYIVVGRPVTQATDPAVAYQEIKAEWSD